MEPGWVGELLRGGVSGFSTILIAVAGLLLLVVCVNLASLLLAQGFRTAQRDGGVACHWSAARVADRQLLLETLTLSVLGGAIGLIGSFGASI